MASSVIAMQTMSLSPVSGAFTNKANVSRFLSSGYVRPLRNRAAFPVRCMTDNQEVENKKSVDDPVSAGPPKTRPMTTTPPPPSQSISTPKVSTKFSDVFAFSGPAPERINGRLAMIGFVAALGVELSEGQDVLTQISNGNGLAWFLATSVILSAASLVPLFQGVRPESKSNGIMTSDAELWNGRFAMLGLVALAFTEYVKGGTLV